MKTLRYSIPNNLSGLHDELLAALPSMKPSPTGPIDPQTGRPENVPQMAVEGIQGTEATAYVQLTVPDDANEAVIRAVVLAHNPNTPRSDPVAAVRASAKAKLMALGLTAAEVASLISGG